MTDLVQITVGRDLIDGVACVVKIGAALLSFGPVPRETPLLVLDTTNTLRTAVGDS